MKWITLRVLNNKTFEFESEMDILISEICLLQQYEKVEDVQPEGGVLIRGYPAFTAVSVKSGLQFRVEERRDLIREFIDSACAENDPLRGERIRGAVARGWCHKKNETKVMDLDLADAIVEEVLKL